jgi:hypothetical protein
MNLSLPPASFYPPGPADYTVNDTILGSAVKLSEWFRNELYRLQNHIQPRHCESYDELVSFIMNPELLDPLKPTPPTVNNYHDTGEIEQQQQQEDEDDDTTDNEDDNVHNIPNNNNNSEQQKKNHQMKRDLPTTLCRVFLEMMRYCGRVGATTNHAPRLLLSEFDKLRQDVKEKKAIHAIEFREKLSKILFGKIQMTEYLIKCWKFMCEWVTRPPLYHHDHAMKWVEMTLSAFLAARRLFLGECIREQQQLLRNKIK